MKKLNKKGFTIVELVIVIAVIAILAAVLIPTFSGIIDKANESSDIQAVREMNTFLASTKITDDVESILDVFDIFEESGFEVENYKPLYKGRTFYYDAQYKKVLYVQDDSGKVIFPKENKDELKNTHDWMSLSLSLGFSSADKPANYEMRGSVISATVSNAKEYAYVIERYNEAADGTALTLEVDGMLDLCGATIVIKETKGPINITGVGENPVVIKNIVSNEFYSVSTNNTSGIAANYQAAAIVASAKHDVTITNVVFENLNVRAYDTGNAGLICGSTAANVCVTLEDVTIKNSTVVGGRSVAALVGASAGSGAEPLSIKGALALDNVKVCTTLGRSALLVTTNSPKAMKIAADATITITDSTCRLLEFAALKQVKTTENTYNGQDVGHRIVDASGNNSADFNIYALKTLGGTEYSFYAHKDDALVLDYYLATGANNRRALMSIDELYAAYR